MSMNSPSTIFTCDYSYSLFLKIVLGLILTFIASLGYFWKKYSFPQAYVDCMVDTYFYGYLNKVVPDHGYEGLKDRIIFYKGKHGLSDEEFPFNRMFIIIPASGYVPSLLQNFDPDGRIELRQELNPQELNRAGVKSRIYKTSVYKINFRGEQKHFSVAMEGAPPLLCLLDSCKENSGLNKHKKKIIYEFYRNLRAKIKENLDFEDAVELVYFNDEGKRSLADELIMKYLDLNDLMMRDI